MPFRKISKDVKIAAMRMYEADLLPLPTILDFLNMSRRTFFRVRALWIETGDVVRQTNGVKGRPRLNHFADIDYLKCLIKHRPDWFLDEMQYLLQTNRFISVHFMTIHRELVRAGISSKKIKKIASERNENLRADYVARMAQYTPDQLGFLDEVSKDERTLARARGRSRKGTRAVQKGVFVRGRRFSAVGLLTLDGMVSNTVVEGSMTRELFLEYLEFTVVSCVFILIMMAGLRLTITRFHFVLHFRVLSAFSSWTTLGSITEKAFLNLLNASVCVSHFLSSIATNETLYLEIRVEFLPPYSPDLNPIEEAFSKVKAFIRRHARLMSHQGDGMIFELMEIMNIVSDEDAIGYFLHAGYF
jgi:transposase